MARIVYLGGLGDDSDDLSAHLRSRREVERLLGATGVPVTALRAGIIIGHGGISWEMTRQLVEHLPAMITPRWVHTRTQPIAVADVVRYLVGVLDVPEAAGRALDVGGPDVLEYLEMMRRVAAIEGRKMLVIPVPLLSPQLSSHWLSLVTSVDVQTGRSLIDSMTNEVVVRDDSIRELVPFEPMDYDAAVLQALGERAKAGRAAGSGSVRLPSRDRLICRPAARWLTEQVPRDHWESDAAFRRRRQVVAATSLAGAGLLGAVAVHPPGLARLLRADPRHRRDLDRRRAGVRPAAPGLDAARRPAAPAGGAGAHRGRRVRPVLRLRAGVQADPGAGPGHRSVLRYADQGSGPLVLVTTLANGAAEEVFFRGALYAAVGSRRPVLTSTAVYMLATTATRNPALVLASGGDGRPVRPAAARLRRHPGADPHPPDLVDADAAVPAAAVPRRVFDRVKEDGVLDQPGDERASSPASSRSTSESST